AWLVLRQTGKENSSYFSSTWFQCPYSIYCSYNPNAGLLYSCLGSFVSPGTPPTALYTFLFHRIYFSCTVFAPYVMANVRILVADDHEVVRKGLCNLLQAHGWEVCGEAGDGRQAVEMAKQLRPDIVILDIGMPNLNGLDATRQILHYNSNQNV